MRGNDTRRCYDQAIHSIRDVYEALHCRLFLKTLAVYAILNSMTDCCLDIDSNRSIQLY